MTETEKEQRRYALAISGGVCEVCGRPYFRGVKKNENIKFI